MNIKEAVSYLLNFKIKVSPAALRAAIRKGDIQNTVINSKKEGIEIPSSSLNEFALKKTSSPFVGFRIGYQQAKEEYTQNMISYQLGSRDSNSFLFETQYDNNYIYIRNNFHSGYNHFYLEIDLENKIIHLFDDLKFSGTSAINMASVDLIVDILNKIGEKPDDDLLKDFILIIYTRSNNVGNGYCFYSCVNKKTGAFGFGTENIEEPQGKLNESFKKLLNEK